MNMIKSDEVYDSGNFHGNDVKNQQKILQKYTIKI